MACCGGQREQMRIDRVTGRARTPESVNGRVVFEYTGPASVVVKGAVTGRGYSFSGYGARAAVDPRDAPSLVETPYLQRVMR